MNDDVDPFEIVELLPEMPSDDDMTFPFLNPPAAEIDHEFSEEPQDEQAITANREDEAAYGVWIEEQAERAERERWWPMWAELGYRSARGEL